MMHQKHKILHRKSVARGGSRYGPIQPQPPFWQLNHANSAYFGAISANSPLPFSTLDPPPPPSFCKSLIRPCVVAWWVGAWYNTFVNCGHLKKFFTAPWLKNLVEYSYLLSKYSVKISREKKWAFSFYFTFCKRGILHVSLWRVAL